MCIIMFVLYNYDAVVSLNVLQHIIVFAIQINRTFLCIIFKYIPCNETKLFNVHVYVVIHGTIIMVIKKPHTYIDLLYSMHVVWVDALSHPKLAEY